jgi:2-oxoisovalerate dehydrogenase E1 component
MQRAGQGFYTIGSSGHEGLAAVSLALRPTDMAFLHYRDAAFQIARAGQVPGQNPAWDMLCPSPPRSDDPISGGRHKVLGSKALMIPPQTSTIASHLPKAVGAAYSVGAARRHRPEHAVLPNDAIVYCSFGDASANHSTAQGRVQHRAVDGLSVGPDAAAFRLRRQWHRHFDQDPEGLDRGDFQCQRPGLKYFKADGLDLYDTYRVAQEAADYVRTRRKPAFLHLRTIRLYGHAGADMPTTYLPGRGRGRRGAGSPAAFGAPSGSGGGDVPGPGAGDLREDLDRVARVAAEAVTRPRLKTAAR